MFWWVLSGYLVASFISFRFPRLLHKPKIPLKKRGKWSHWAIAHRGGSAERPENTIDAFRHSCELGIDILELDVVITRDGVVMVAHDNHLQRVCGKDEFITSTGYENLPPYLPEIKTHFIDHKLVFNHKVYQLTTLEQLFQECKDTYMMIDLKVPDSQTIKEIKRLIDKYDMYEHVVTYI